MAKRLFDVAETEYALSESDFDDWSSVKATDAEQAAELFAAELNNDRETISDDETFDLSVKSEDGSIKRFTVHASLSWSYSATEKGDAL